MRKVKPMGDEFQVSMDELKKKQKEAISGPQQNEPEVTGEIPILEKKEMPYWEGYGDGHKDGMHGAPSDDHAYHHVVHTETYNKRWVERETQMTLEEIGRHVEFIRRCMGMAGVGFLAVLLITLLK